jgi:hypothetical protein
MNLHTPIPFSQYIRIDSLPADQQRPFARWILLQTRPVVRHELDAHRRPAACAFRWDYEHWLAEGEPSTLPNPFDR